MRRQTPCCVRRAPAALSSSASSPCGPPMPSHGPLYLSLVKICRERRGCRASRLLARRGNVRPSKPWLVQRWPARARRWHGAWQEHRAAVARVAGCVTRQRISFRLFKLWYWGSFDEEIQARPAPAEHHPAEHPLCSAPVSEQTCHACSPTKARQDGSNACTSSVRP